eukprot:SAG22_NODE_5266_length_1050_cov_1.030494_1_plen_242_part_10
MMLPRIGLLLAAAASPAAAPPSAAPSEPEPEPESGPSARVFEEPAAGRRLQQPHHLNRTSCELALGEHFSTSRGVGPGPACKPALPFEISFNPQLANCTVYDVHGFCARGIHPLHSKTISVFHVNPSRYGDAPVSMDTADARGVMVFSLKTAFIPYECAPARPGRPRPMGAGLDCRDAEEVDSDLVVTKLTLQVDSRYGTYQMCKVCVDGTDPLGGGGGPPPGKRKKKKGGGGGAPPNHPTP